MDGDMKQPEDDAQNIKQIKQPDQTKKSKKAADSGNSEEEEAKKGEEKCSSNDGERHQEEDSEVPTSEKKQEGQDTEQPEDTNTEVHNQKKESEKGDMKQPEDDAQNIKQIKQPDQTKKSKKAADSGNSEEEEAKKGEEKCSSNDGERHQEEDSEVPTSEKKQEGQDTEQPEDTNTEVHNQKKESEKGDMKQPEDDAQNIKQIKQPDQTKKSKKAADSGNSEEEEEDKKEEEKCSSNDGERHQEEDSEVPASEKKLEGQDTEQPEDTDTEVHNQQKESEKDTIWVSSQSNDQENLDMTDGECIKPRNENNEVLQSEEGLRKRSSNKNQTIEQKGEDDHTEKIGIPPTADTSSERHQEEDSDVPSSEKDTIGVSGQSNDQENLDRTDGKCIKPRNENNEVLQSEEGLRKRSSNKNQKLEQKGEDDHIEKIGIPPTANTFRWFVLCTILLFLIAFAVVAWWRSPSPSQKDLNLLDVFYQEMDKVQASFPSQRHELWRRSRIHLQKHLNLTDPTEPVSLILTSGSGAKKTLGCLAQQLAAAFSKALNSTFLDIDGTSKTAQDSDQVKLDIDKALKEAFEGGKQAAVIHRFEELPPGSTLIFYRYCDHENAAFKKVFLAFTVMLQEKMDFQPNVSLGMVEEDVQDYLKEKFVLSDRIAKFNQMDLDKLGGLWSRISHVILPVTAEQKIEQHGCQT
ncbi:torsin-1A-interacting protein 2 isoform X1 [Clarias gariepinus]|uniref:torsin-1A-interacting protein 2 isoform X1 n=1 Tax=Clarias gariepinus TaxID=13013 RepID=UPI00234C30E2|nr:torsin-1A-interacting protein 2 isoform X1 [Clarias gariepinus]